MQAVEAAQQLESQRTVRGKHLAFSGLSDGTHVTSSFSEDVVSVATEVLYTNPDLVTAQPQNLVTAQQPNLVTAQPQIP